MLQKAVNTIEAHVERDNEELLSYSNKYCNLLWKNQPQVMQWWERVMEYYCIYCIYYWSGGDNGSMIWKKKKVWTENATCCTQWASAATHTHPPPAPGKMYPKETLRMRKHRILAPKAKVHIKEWSHEPRLLHLLTQRKALNSFTWDYLVFFN